MAQVSRSVRRARKLKREKSVAYRMMDAAIKQRDQARMIAFALETELKKHDPKPEVSIAELGAEANKAENKDINVG